jgi:hypothetical protein
VHDPVRTSAANRTHGDRKLGIDRSFARAILARNRQRNTFYSKSRSFGKRALRRDIPSKVKRLRDDAGQYAYSKANFGHAFDAFVAGALCDFVDDC